MTKNNKLTNRAENKENSDIQVVPEHKKDKVRMLRKTKVEFETRENKSGFAIKDLSKKEVLKGFFEAFGSYDLDISKGLVNSLSTILSGEGVTAEDLNFGIAIIKELEPQDPIEAMLAIQMLGNHLLSCKTLYRASLKDQTIEGVTENINRTTKLQRTFISQMEALKKHRNKGNQKITVEHININDGGKAVIGSTLNTQINNQPN